MVAVVTPIERERSLQAILSALENVVDPEIPALSIRAIGILRDVRMDEDGSIEVVITPTYSGCPAVEQIVDEIKRVLAGMGGTETRVTRRFNPPWTTDWIGDEARETLKANGIAPPVGTAPAHHTSAVEIVSCPRCNSRQCELISLFGSTSCKAQYRCRSCREPFAYFKHF
ncbi:1,2-phenylacetyl-CoA epoxidase subunit PaaD [Paraburkholderia fungorum]|uniref:1,2-phenylacetyl-CoA epoxidase subunit PaaD n=1 Tax=Paraburkholderia fungorum TaxID=134537 RepID=UPI002096B701|nr:1,2-phenylacetyl-CoA epoxidase subunit PaaD [Paraburkholderia fungorum]USX06611.1 phenylacetate-CoA oxygenase subunit PaaJ [Paraburkholderia fungorum]